MVGRCAHSNFPRDCAKSIGSRAPFLRLHGPQDRTRFRSSWRPPLDSGSRWSMCHLAHLAPHQWQILGWRASHARSSAALTPLAFWLFLLWLVFLWIARTFSGLATFHLRRAARHLSGFASRHLLVPSRAQILHCEARPSQLLRLPLKSATDLNWRHFEQRLISERVGRFMMYHPCEQKPNQARPN